MTTWKNIEALCIRLRISESQAMNAMQTEGRAVISDNAVKFEDIADADVPGAVAFLKSRFGPDQPELI